MQECDAPLPQEIAINLPRGGLHGYEDILAVHHNYWQTQEIRAFASIDLGRHAVSKMLFDALHQSGTVHYAFEIDRLDEPLHVQELARRTALGSLALSMLFRCLWSSSDPIQDRTSPIRADHLLDGDLSRGFTEEMDYRIHTLPQKSAKLFPAPASPSGERWYQKGPLFIRRVWPAVPTPAAAFSAQVSAAPIDFLAMETLFPYLAAQRPLGPSCIIHTS